MESRHLIARGPCHWELPASGGMRVPLMVYAEDALLRQMDDKALEQAVNVVGLPGIVGASYMMPDAHWGYGFPIGGVAGFDAEAGGVVSAGGVGFDISCGVRALLTGLRRAQIVAVQERLADPLATHILAGLGSTGAIRLSNTQMDAMLAGGARWAVQRGWGLDADLQRTEEHGQMLHAKPGLVSEQAKRRQREEMGAMRAAINCALANRQILTHLVCQVFAKVLPGTQLPLLYDVSHNTCKLEQHRVNGHLRSLYVHRKGATRAFGPGHAELPEALRAAGRAMSRHAASKQWQGRQVVDQLAAQGIMVRSQSLRGVAEEAPLACKDVAAVVDCAQSAGLARKVARLAPMICIKG